MPRDTDLTWKGRFIWMKQPRPTTRTRRTIFNWELVANQYVLIYRDKPYQEWMMHWTEFSNRVQMYEFRYYHNREDEKWRR